MTPAQKQTTQYELLSEKKVMEQLERSYQKALEDVKDRLRQLDERTDEENRQAVAYQKAFQQGLQKQLERILGKLHSKTYRTVQEYLQDCYLTGHTAVLYELQSDGLRLSLPVPQDKVCQAAVNDTKLVKPLYDSIGEDFAGLKKHITDIVSAGFASGASYGDMANQITGKMIGNYATLRGGALGRAKLIVRTEGNRIANAARLEAARTAKQQGADLVKQWDSTMDKKTRPHHVQLDGQVRELDEPFEVDGRKAQAPGKFGIASEDINCRCHAYSRPRWAVRADGDYKYDNQHRALVKVSSESYAAYRAGYVQETAGKSDGTVPVPAGHAVEVTPPATKDNGGTGKTYRAEKIGGKALTSGADSGIIEAEYKRFHTGEEVNKYFGGSGGILEKQKSCEKRWVKSLTQNETGAVVSYCADGYYDINTYFRKTNGAEFIDPDSMESFARDLDSAISKFELKDSITVYRGVDNNALVGLDLNSIVGSIYEDNGYMSASPIHADIVDRRDALFEIQVPAGKGVGAYVNSLSGFKDDEYEFLLKRGTRCEILSVDLSSEKPIIKMRVIK